MTNLLQPVELIKTKEQHTAYLQELQELMKLDPPKDTPEGDRLGLLVLVIQDYENEHYPIPQAFSRETNLAKEVLEKFGSDEYLTLPEQIQKQVTLRLERKKREGKPLISEENVDQMINEVLDEFENGTIERTPMNQEEHIKQLQAEVDRLKTELAKGEIQYYWNGEDFYTEDPINHYEMELEDDEIVELEVWLKIDKSPVYCANIYTHDECEIHMFSSEEEAKKAQEENKKLRSIFYGEEQAND